MKLALAFPTTAATAAAAAAAAAAGVSSFVTSSSRYADVLTRRCYCRHRAVSTARWGWLVPAASSSISGTIVVAKLDGHRARSIQTSSTGGGQLYHHHPYHHYPKKDRLLLWSYSNTSPCLSSRRSSSSLSVSVESSDADHHLTHAPPPPGGTGGTTIALPITAETTILTTLSPESNIPPHIAAKVFSNRPKLYHQSPHPLYLVKRKIEEYFHVGGGDDGVGVDVDVDGVNDGDTDTDTDTDTDAFVSIDNLSPIVSTASNFDSLLIPLDHPSRSRSDTYYLDSNSINDTTQYCLRTHTSAHQVELLQTGHGRFLCTGDVYRRDDVDKSHYPVFHQMEGVKVFVVDNNNNNNDNDNSRRPPISEKEVMDDLKRTLEGLAVHLFGPDTECRWVEEYFPFTHPSLELEVRFGGSGDDNDDDNDGEWLEVLGCGVMRPEIVQRGLTREGDEEGTDPDKTAPPPLAWAFGLGLERLAMILFAIPDIRLFWTDDVRFWSQFDEDRFLRRNEPIKFQPYSKFPPVFKDVSFWLLSSTLEVEEEGDGDAKDGGGDGAAASAFHVNELLDLVRGVAGDLVETVQLVDRFVHPTTQRESHCYRITYRSMDRSLTNEEIDHMQEELRQKIATDLASVVQLR